MYPYSSIMYLIIIPVPYIPSIICNNTFESFPLSPATIRKCLCFSPNKLNNYSDGLPKGVLKILSFELCEPLSIIYSSFLKEGYCQMYGNIPTLHLYIRKVTQH